MKKIFITTFAFLVLLVGCSSTKKADMSAYTLMTTKDHQFNAIDTLEGFDKIIDREPGVYYVGFDTCPWCQYLVPVLNDALVSHEKTAFYIDTRPAGASDTVLASISSKYLSVLNTMEGENSEGFVPFLVVISDDGTYTTHVGTAPSHDARVNPMTELETNYVIDVLNAMLS